MKKYCLKILTKKQQQFKTKLKILRKKTMFFSQTK